MYINNQMSKKTQFNILAPCSRLQQVLSLLRHNYLVKMSLTRALIEASARDQISQKRKKLVAKGTPIYSVEHFLCSTLSRFW